MSHCDNLHHLDDEAVRRTLAHISSALSIDGIVNILNWGCLMNGVSGIFSKIDQGLYGRAVDQWNDMFSKHFDKDYSQMCFLSLGGIRFYKILYFKRIAKN